MVEQGHSVCWHPQLLFLEHALCTWCDRCSAVPVLCDQQGLHLSFKQSMVIACHHFIQTILVQLSQKYRKDQTHAPIDEKPMFYPRIKHRKSVFYGFSPHCLYIIKQMKEPKQGITLWKTTPDIWEHLRNVENKSLWLMFLHFPRVLKTWLCFITM